MFTLQMLYAVRRNRALNSTEQVFKVFTTLEIQFESYSGESIKVF